MDSDDNVGNIENDDYILYVPRGEEEEEKDGPMNWSALDSDSESENENIHSNFLASLDKSERVWTSDSNYTPQVHNFDESKVNPGYKLDLNENSSPADFFEQLLDLQIVEKIAEETNKCAKTAEHISRFPRSKKWRDTNAPELYVFFALTLLMARKRAFRLQEYWSTTPSIHQPFFSKIMPRDRFLMILSRLSFNMNHDPNNMLTMIQPFLDRIRETFKSALVPFQNLRILESQSALLGHDVSHPYISIPKKKIFMNTFVLYDVKSDFIVDLVVQVGSRKSVHASGGTGVSGAVVTTLMEDFFGKGHIVHTDYWYTSPLLYNFMHSKGTNACGVVLPARAGMPTFKELVKDESDFKCTDNMMAIKWKDRSDGSCMLSTMHDASFIAPKRNDGKRNVSMKPLVCIDYETTKVTTNKSELLIGQVACLKNCCQWHHKIAFHFLDLIFVNTHVAYEAVTGKKIPLANFQLELISDLVDRHHAPAKVRINQVATSAVAAIAATSVRFSGRHYLSKVPTKIINEGSKVRQQRDIYRRCHVCANTQLKTKRQQKTRYVCLDCNVSLCAIPCFKIYHENKNF